MTTSDPFYQHRRSIRLKGYDYTTAGVYFVTVVTNKRDCLFGQIVDGEMELNDCGRFAAAEWARTANLRPRVTLDAWIVMPNHFHAINALQDCPAVQRGPCLEAFGKPVSDSIPTIVRLFKSATTKLINLHRGTPGIPVWQRGYYEHIIRDDRSLDRLRDYILNNADRWADDRENPLATR